MKTNISVFVCLDIIAQSKSIKDEFWAEKAEIRRPTISELRHLAKYPNIPIGRSCTIEKVSALYNGLLKIMGGKELKKQIGDFLDREPDQMTRIFLLALATKDADRNGKDLIENTMKMVLKANSGTSET